MTPPAPVPFDVPLMTAWLGHPLRFVPELDSTNRRLRQWLDTGQARTGTVLVTDHQLAGRGRRGRTWDAPPGTSLLLSAALTPLPAARLGLLPIVVAVALADTVRSALARPPQLKWPNDLLLDGRKCGGILLESVTRAEGRVEGIAGIGLNVNQQAGEMAALPGATSLRIASGRALECGRLLAALLRHLERRYEAFVGGWQPHDAWRRYAVGLNEEVLVRPKQGEAWPATIRDLYADGRLEVEERDGTRHLLDAEEVSLRGA